ncbi:TRAP transporter substrate-binding protein [Marinovum sp.]|uniref:TRAP transporter substrate-binding protein n=1 Tax=Marinovum sp. TaxID=2024839 RepID=UPI002B27BA23|nr:TRAP transporter substrate-binding protein [Marinovum sp.]
MKKQQVILAGLAVSLMATSVMAETPVRVLTQILPTAMQYPNEAAAIEKLNDSEFTVQYNNYEGLGLSTADGLRLVSDNAFNIVSVQIGTAARDDAFFEGLDLIGVSPDMESLKTAVDSYRDVFDTRLRERFGATVLALWPFGPQVFYCNADISSVSDLKGLKIRSFTPSMSALLDSFGATPVTLNFGEVYPALQRGVADCGVTSPTSGNSGAWPEVTTHQLPLSVSGSVQGIFANLGWWESLTEEERTAISEAYSGLEEAQWELASTVNNDAISCNTGAENCTQHKPFDMTLVEVSDDDRAAVSSAAAAVVIPDWINRCEASYPGCTQVWNETVGAARGFTAEAPM